MPPVTSPLPSVSFRSPLAKQRAFSLIEVVLAVGVVAFAFVAILGLIPAGMGQFRQAIDTSVCAQIAQRVINDSQETDFTTLIDEKSLPTTGADDYAFRTPSILASNAATATLPGKCIRYFDEQGSEVIPAAVNGTPSTLEKQRVAYMVNTRVIPRTIVPSRSDFHIYHLATLTIQVAYNPGIAPITLSSAAPTSTDPTRKLWVRTAGVSIITYCAQIGRN